MLSGEDDSVHLLPLRYFRAVGLSPGPELLLLFLGDYVPGLLLHLARDVRTLVVFEGIGLAKILKAARAKVPEVVAVDVFPVAVRNEL